MGFTVGALDYPKLFLSPLWTASGKCLFHGRWRSCCGTSRRSSTQRGREAALAAAKTRPFSPDLASVATLRMRDCVCSVAVLRVILWTGATSHSARTTAQGAGQSSAPKRSSLASKQCAQLLSEAFTAGRPRRSQPLSTSAFQADSGANEEGLL